MCDEPTDHSELDELLAKLRARAAENRTLLDELERERPERDAEAAELKDAIARLKERMAEYERRFPARR